MGGPTACGLSGGGAKTYHVKRTECDETFCKDSHLEGFFGMISAAENERKVLNSECQESVLIRFVEKLSRELVKYKIDLEGLQEVRWKKVA
jgi:hypothetical protein